MKAIKYTCLILLIVLGYGLTKHKSDEQMRERKSELKVKYLPGPTLAKFMAAGYELALADIFWLEAINYYGNEIHYKTLDFRYLPGYLNVIRKLDPLFAYFYNWGSTVYIYNGKPITRIQLIQAIDLANHGIKTLAEHGRYDPVLIQKGAFNYALDAGVFQPSVAYFELLGRSFSDLRDMLLVGATYAKYSGQLDKEQELREEYLAYLFFSATQPKELTEAISLVMSSALVSQSVQYVKELRLSLEKDDQMREIVAQGLTEKEFNVPDNAWKRFSIARPLSKTKVIRLMEVDIKKNWIPSELHLLFHAI